MIGTFSSWIANISVSAPWVSFMRPCSWYKEGACSLILLPRWAFLSPPNKPYHGHTWAIKIECSNLPGLQALHCLTFPLAESLVTNYFPQNGSVPRASEGFRQIWPHFNSVLENFYGSWKPKASVSSWTTSRTRHLRTAVLCQVQGGSGDARQYCEDQEGK